jgi:hypothetical protein
MRYRGNEAGPLTFFTRQQQCLPQPDSLSPVSEGFVGDPWLFIMLTLCHILHFVSHWLVLSLSISTVSGCVVHLALAEHV